MSFECVVVCSNKKSKTNLKLWQRMISQILGLTFTKPGKEPLESHTRCHLVKELAGLAALKNLPSKTLLVGDGNQRSATGSTPGIAKAVKAFIDLQLARKGSALQAILLSSSPETIAEMQADVTTQPTFSGRVLCAGYAQLAEKLGEVTAEPAEHSPPNSPVPEDDDQGGGGRKQKLEGALPVLVHHSGGAAAGAPPNAHGK